MKMYSGIGVMTWHTYENYGSVLQAGALCKVVRTMGYNPELIQYIPKGRIEKIEKRSSIVSYVGKIKSKLNPIYNSNRKSKLFSEFLKSRVSFSILCNSYPELHDLNQIYDAFICGSDQIWSPLCYDSKYFLDFVDDSNKIIAYAPSIGSTEIVNPIIREQMGAYISRFKYLSIREKQGAALIKDLTGQDAKVVLDPTLLMNPSEWDTYIQEEKVQKLQDKEYIICYFLGDADKYMGYVHMISKKIGIPYHLIPVTVKQKKTRESVPFEVGPCEFVSLIKNAQYVVTDSFHGAAFSVNYNRPFSVLKRFRDGDPQNQNSRIFNLLQMLGLEARLVDYCNKRNVQTKWDCDFTEANNRLNKKRFDSLGYLKNALENATGVSVKQKDSLFKITDMCCGCGVCVSVCNKDAISIIKNREGFEHYSIDTFKCVRCGQCETVCPMTNISAPQIKESKSLYSVKSHSKQTLEKSSSGGVGHELAYALLNKKYAVCGCRYDMETNTARHIWIMPGQKERLQLLQGSKYIQSITADAMKDLMNVAKHQKIAFFGTPCQAAAVDRLLRKKDLRDNAVIIDLICHGVPSYYLWDKYLMELNKKYSTSSHPSVSFRSKEWGWRRMMMVAEGNGHIYKKEEHEDDFYAFFRRGLCYMESCFDCPYRERSAADLRIGDYWGDKYKKDKQGVSMVITNTICGEQMIENLSVDQLCRVKKQELSEYWSVQYPYNPQKPLIREKLIEELKHEDTDLHKLRKKYCIYYERAERIGKVVRFVKKVLKRGK